MSGVFDSSSLLHLKSLENLSYHNMAKLNLVTGNKNFINVYFTEIFLLFQKEAGIVQIGKTSTPLVGLEVTQNLAIPLLMVSQLVILWALNVLVLHKL